MTLTYKEKVEKGLSLAKTLDDVAYIEIKIRETEQINRRTKVGRELTRELLGLANTKANELIDNGAEPF